MECLTRVSLMLLSIATLTDSQTSNGNILSFFVFGDSYTDSGFNESSPAPSIAQPLGFPPIGPYPDDLLGNPLIANQSTANGPNWVEWLTANYNTTTTLTYNFAISGASIPDGFRDQILNLYEPHYASLFSPNTSGQQITTPAGSGVSWNSNTSIFASWIGINDINWCSHLFTPYNSTFSSCMPPRMDEYFELMDSLYNTGARNFLFLNLPPLDRAPMVVENGANIINNFRAGVKYFNDDLLPTYVNNFTSTHKGVRSRIYDAHAFWTKILDHPEWYGFRNNHCYSCIGCYNVTGCMWSNNYHPVWQVHERLAGDLVGDLTALGWPVLEF